MTIEQAITKSKEGGFNTKDSAGFNRSTFQYFLDPSFWQSLGKVMEWKTKRDLTDDNCSGWQDYWHRFIDHLAEGKNGGELL